MEFGVSTFVTDEGITPVELGRALEERGFESLFIAEGGAEEITRRCAELQRRAVEAGRARIPVSVYDVPGDREIVSGLVGAGVDRVLFDLPTSPVEETVRALEEFTAIARSFRA